MSAGVILSGISHSFSAQPVLRGIDLEIEAGSYVTLLGPSGCGKTTLLSVLGGFVTPDHGRVQLGGQDMAQLPPARRPTATVFQDYALFPHMSLAENVGFGLRMAGMGRAARRARAEAMLALVGLTEAAGKRPHQISGGQRQRVALARALAVAPKLLLLDEPLGALDLKLRRAMQDELKAIQRQVGTTFLHVTHDQEEAMAIADRIVVMNAGRIEDDGPPARIYRQPATLFAAGFMGEMNRIPARLDAGGADTPLGRLPLSSPHEGPATLCIRPEALRVDGTGLALGTARLTDAAFFGTHIRAHLRPEPAPDLTLIAHLPADSTTSPGARVTLSAAPDALLVFPNEA
ncbi:MAG: ABC transporter ATP-binding protein [Pseudomonadota bacterium]